MKRFSILTQVLTTTLIISACGARTSQATSTIDPVDLQSTMVSAASTLVAETQAAIPTGTPPCFAARTVWRFGTLNAPPSW